MAITDNYGLYLTDNDQENFYSWREKLNGQTGSNMIKIDNALSEKADKSRSIETKLLGRIIDDNTGDGWYFSEIDGYYIYIIDCDIKAKHNGVISVSNMATSVERSAARDAMLFVHSQTSGMLIVGADGDVPTVDIPVTIIINN